LSVYQIEKLIIKLNLVLSRGISDEAALVRDRDNWMAVLATYRNHSASVMPAFSNSDQILNAAVNSILSQEGDMLAMVAEFITRVGSTVSHRDVVSTFSRLKAVCGDAVLRSVSTTLCNDFQHTQWSSLAAALDHVCTKNGTLGSDISNTAYLGGFCSNSQGERSGGTFAFLQDTTKYLSYASHSPINMKFTSAVSNSLSLVTTFRSSDELSTIEGKTVNVGGVITKNHQDHKSTREVTVALGDNNLGPFTTLLLDIAHPSLSLLLSY
jgi:hypothetical protein